MKLDKFLPLASRRDIVECIRQAELRTSGEIRVHVEPKCPTADPCERAVQVFNELKMYQTRKRNAALIYIAYKSRHLAIIGDSGINDVTPDDFWSDEMNTLAQFLKQGKAGEGVCQVIAQIGEKLREFFPPQDDDTNEQSDEISFGE